MPILYHLPFDPFSRKGRIILAEKQIEAELVTEQPWLKRQEFLHINPAGEVPVLHEPGKLALSPSQVIAEYLEETLTSVPLLPSHPAARAEIRRLCAWFDRKFHEEVTSRLVGEKLSRHLTGRTEPDSARIRTGYTNIDLHLSYINLLAEERNWLGGNQFSLADISAAAHLSCLDYLGDVPWHDHLDAKNWYSRVKSRPSFQSLLRDVIPGQRPPPHYADIDF